ncbi:hypothetical protein GS597_00785 [Synechococcales cyanobacterium C]|uniref:Uncharacterized protein n=1 Tax=Petrachloros mirabilis ULC683 TaxID=2781853 RepID=A0A8K2A6C8_9CYAN|nr:hypothetical protein [Petrachloros mirabilis]NCJ05075.1 hypothetical protein [Petrachloros mirabilis ULC683]
MLSTLNQWFKTGLKITRHAVCFGCALLLLGVSQGAMSLNAIAAPSLNTAPLFAKVASPSEGLDAIAGSGTSDKLEGVADQAAGSFPSDASALQTR